LVIGPIQLVPAQRDLGLLARVDQSSARNQARIVVEQRFTMPRTCSTAARGGEEARDWFALRLGGSRQSSVRH
jgi:hypothetical protein